jgi:hypothetical protein
MTGNSDEWEPVSDQTPASEEMDPKIDPYLADLVHTVETVAAAGREAMATVRLPVTLIVGGAIVSGEITAGREWWPEYEKQLLSADASPTTTPGVVNALSQAMAERIRRVWHSFYASDEAPRLSELSYVHLKDAHVVHPQGFVPGDVQGTLMRLKLAEVLAWSFGTYVPQSVIS